MWPLLIPLMLGVPLAFTDQDANLKKFFELSAQSISNADWILGIVALIDFEPPSEVNLFIVVVETCESAT